MKFILPPDILVWLLKIGTGVGKSTEVQRLIKHLVTMIPPDTCIVIFTPTHNLNDEHLERLVALLEDTGANVAIYRGRNADDPDRQGKKMCDFSSEAAKLSAAGGDQTQLCSKKTKERVVRCPYYNECGYRKQHQQRPQIWIAPHSLWAHKRPSCIPQPAAIFNDEDPSNVFFGGFDQNYPVRVSMDELRQTRTVPFKRGGRRVDINAQVDLEAATNALLKALPIEGAITRQSLIDHGLTARIADDANRAV